MAFLEDLVDCDERLECLDFIGKNWLPVSSVSIASVAFMRSKLWFGALPSAVCFRKALLAGPDRGYSFFGGLGI